MADYWKSQAKKFCEFCKCWIADNKPSVEFHEKGKRHKENVGKRLSEIGKKSQKEYRNSLKVDDEMRKMEEAALKAYMKDVETNPDFTSLLIKEKLAQKEEESINIKTEPAEEQETSRTAAAADVQVKTEPGKLWYEAQTDEGYTYYWHIETGESKWEPPEEGYMSIAEQKEEEKKELKKKEEEEKKRKKEEERKRKLEEERKKEEERARLEREKMKSRRVKEEEKPLDCAMPVLGPAPKPDPYGAWKPVDRSIPKPVDLQLPKQDFIEIKVPVVTEPQMKFKEKTFTSLGDEGGGDSNSFKKRKFNSNPKRNMRQRLDED